MDFRLLNAVENRIAPHSGEIVPSPLYDRLNLRSHVCQQRDMDAKPCNESDHAVEVSAANAHFGYCRVSANHRHDSLINVAKWFSGPACRIQCDILCTPTAGLLCYRG